MSNLRFLANEIQLGPLGYSLIGIGLCILIVCSSFFSSFETAFSTCNQVRIRNMIEEKVKGAKEAVWICEHFDRTLTTILVGNNFVNIAATTLAAFLLTNLINNPTLSNIINTFGMTLIILCFGEIIPKCSARVNADRFTLRYSKLMRFLIKMLYPIVSFFMWLKKIFIKDKSEEQVTVTETELELIIDTMEEEGVIDSDDADLMQSVIEISERTIYDIMIPRVDMISIEDSMPINEIKAIFFEYKFSRLPVYHGDKDHIIGILQERDFFTYLLSNQNLKDFDISKLITKPLYVSKTMKVDDLIRRMQIEKKHLAIVSDEYGGTSGIVTMEDALEEIVGEIYDEHDEASDMVEELTKIDDLTYVVSAEMPMDELYELLELGKAPDSSYTNVGGFLYSLAEEVPTEGETFNWDTVVFQNSSNDEVIEEKKIHLKFTILKVIDRRIIKARLEILNSIEEDTENEKKDV